MGKLNFPVNKSISYSGNAIYQKLSANCKLVIVCIFAIKPSVSSPKNKYHYNCSMFAVRREATSI